jgi:hypothetical protein
MATVYPGRRPSPRAPGRHQGDEARYVPAHRAGTVHARDRNRRAADTSSHPALYDSGTAGDQLYYVMPHIMGGSLRGKLDREGRLPVEVAVRSHRASRRDSGTRTSAARASGHQAANVLLSDGIPLVADFRHRAVHGGVAGVDRGNQDNHAADHARARDPGHAAVHGARAGVWRDGSRSAHRHLTRSGACSSKCSPAIPRTSQRRRRPC